MILNHITQGSGLIVVATPSPFHAKVLSTSNLNMINIFFIPHWLENRVGKTKNHNILGSLLPEIMIDSIGVFFLKSPIHHFV